ncbi:hypothetical protein SVAN01_05692 [Stagonosporopsis vannaccii]|nr:hypothetical protein SVAN01_05692 [Stagonosporopsis vannaccii]
MWSKNSTRGRRGLGSGGSLRSRVRRASCARDESSPVNSGVLREGKDALWEGRTVAGRWGDGGGRGWACGKKGAAYSKSGEMEALATPTSAELFAAAAQHKQLQRGDACCLAPARMDSSPGLEDAAS